MVDLNGNVAINRGTIHIIIRRVVYVFNDFCFFLVFVCMHASVFFFLLLLFFLDTDHWSDANK